MKHLHENGFRNWLHRAFPDLGFNKETGGDSVTFTQDQFREHLEAAWNESAHRWEGHIASLEAEAMLQEE